MMACAFIRSMLHSGLCNYRGASIIDEFLILNRKCPEKCPICNSFSPLIPKSKMIEAIGGETARSTYSLRLTRINDNISVLLQMISTKPQSHHLFYSIV
jgi:hypothetical protein